MTIFFHELRRNKWALLIWTGIIAYMLGICIVLYPEMAPQMTQMTDMFANMGDFTAAFGMDQLNFGEFIGYFAIECGNVLGLGGGLFAGITGIAALAKEEKEHTAEFLLTHPISRSDVVDQKLLAVLAQITFLNVVVAAVCVAGAFAIGEGENMSSLVLLFVAYYLLQLEIGAITFGISAFLKKGGLGIGLGLGFGFYFMNILSNLTEDLKVLKYITPYGYCDGSWIVDRHTLQWEYLTVGMVMAAVGIALAFWRYERKDIAA